MVDGGAQGPATKDHLGKPQCPSNWTRGAQQDIGPHQESFLVAWYVEHRGSIHAILSGLPIGKIRPQEKDGSILANPTTRAEMVANYNRPDHRFTRV